MSRSSTQRNMRDLTISAVCLALCMVLPFLVGQLPEVARAISPMHIPVLIAGFAVGPLYAAIIGFIAPLLRFMIFGMPQMPNGVAMAFELATYGAVAGILYGVLPKKIPFIYISLISAMLVGRIVWGISRALIQMGTADSFTFALFIAGGFTNAIPGIILHIAIIPPIVMALKKARLLE